MSDLYPTRTRLDLLRAIDSKRVRLTPEGYVMRRTDSGLTRRCDASVREFQQAGWVRIGGDDGSTYELTDAGRVVLDGGSQ